MYYPSAARMLTRATTSPGFGFFERALPTTAKHRKRCKLVMLIYSRDVIISDQHTMIICNNMSRIIPHYTRTISFRDLK